MFSTVVVVGDSGVGKTTLLMSYTTNIDLPKESVFTVVDNHTVQRTVDDIVISLDLFDTAARYDYIRPFAYPRTDVFLVCFSIVGPNSYESVRTKWYPELAHHGHDSASTKIVLVGTKLDLRNDSKMVEDLGNHRLSSISHSQGRSMARDIGAIKYCECSAVTRQGVKTVFDEAMRAAVYYSPLKTKKITCIIA